MHQKNSWLQNSSVEARFGHFEDVVTESIADSFKREAKAWVTATFQVVRSTALTNEGLQFSAVVAQLRKQ